MLLLLLLHLLHVAGERVLQVPTVLTVPQALETEDNTLLQATADLKLPCIHQARHLDLWYVNTAR